MEAAWTDKDSLNKLTAVNKKNLSTLRQKLRKSCVFYEKDLEAYKAVRAFICGRPDRRQTALMCSDCRTRLRLKGRISRQSRATTMTMRTSRCVILYHVASLQLILVFVATG